jgi:hypothetical protein
MESASISQILSVQKAYPFSIQICVINEIWGMTFCHDFVVTKQVDRALDELKRDSRQPSLAAFLDSSTQMLA